MIIPTKYSIGYTYWVPRVHKIFDRTETLCYEGEEWTRDVYEMKAFAKQKVVKAIEIGVHENGSVRIIYGVANTDETGADLLQWYPEANIPDSHDEETAQAFAESYLKDNPDEEYFGN
jgi:hypothetical protein